MSGLSLRLIERVITTSSLRWVDGVDRVAAEWRGSLVGAVLTCPQLALVYKESLFAGIDGEAFALDQTSRQPNHR